jgi:hypothetical protein
MPKADQPRADVSRAEKLLNRAAFPPIKAAVIVYR